MAYHLSMVTTTQSHYATLQSDFEGDAEIAELDIARPENAAPDQTEVLDVKTILSVSRFL